MEKRHRIFIAINLPENIKEKLGKYSQKWPNLPAKWTKPENLHITLVFIGDINEERILEIKKAIACVVKEQKPFFMALNQVCYGPLKIMPPRMVWLIAEKSQEYALLCKKLEKVLSESTKISFRPERNELTPHVTLARIKEWQWQRIEPDERPEIEEFIDLKFQVESIDLMESILKRIGPEYKILESYQLNK